MLKRVTSPIAIPIKRFFNTYLAIIIIKLRIHLNSTILQGFKDSELLMHTGSSHSSAAMAARLKGTLLSKCLNDLKVTLGHLVAGSVTCDIKPFNGIAISVSTAMVDAKVVLQLQNALKILQQIYKAPCILSVKRQSTDECLFELVYKNEDNIFFTYVNPGFVTLFDPGIDTVPTLDLDALKSFIKKDALDEIKSRLEKTLRLGGMSYKSGGTITISITDKSLSFAFIPAEKPEKISSEHLLESYELSAKMLIELLDNAIGVPGKIEFEMKDFSTKVVPLKAEILNSEALQTSLASYLRTIPVDASNWANFFKLLQNLRFVALYEFNKSVEVEFILGDPRNPFYTLKAAGNFAEYNTPANRAVTQKYIEENGRYAKQINKLVQLATTLFNCKGSFILSIAGHEDTREEFNAEITPVANAGAGTPAADPEDEYYEVNQFSRLMSLLVSIAQALTDLLPPDSRPPISKGPFVKAEFERSFLDTIKLIQEHITSLVKQIADTSTELALAKATVLALRGDKEALTSKISAAEKAHDERPTRDAVEREKAILKKQIDQLNSKIEALHQQLVAKDKERQTLQARLDGAVAANEKLKSAANDFKQRESENIERIRAQERAINEIIPSLKGQIEHLNKTIEELKAQLVAQRGEYAAAKICLDAQLLESEANANHLRHDLDAALAQSANLSQQLASAESLLLAEKSAKAAAESALSKDTLVAELRRLNDLIAMQTADNTRVVTNLREELTAARALPVATAPQFTGMVTTLSGSQTPAFSIPGLMPDHMIVHNPGTGFPMQISASAYRTRDPAPISPAAGQAAYAFMPIATAYAASYPPGYEADASS